MEQNKKINIGLDIGIASVGWAILDNESNEIIDLGVRLFDEANSGTSTNNGNIKRREARHRRRTLRREKLRKLDFCKLLVQNEMFLSNEDVKKCLKDDIFENGKSLTLLELRIKATKQKVSNDELAKVLHWYIKHRGFFYETEETYDGNAESELLPVAIHSKLVDVKGFHKGAIENSKISHKKYEKELEIIFERQNLPTNFKERYLKIFNRVRDFSKGPGSEKSPTKYGMWRKENGVIAKIEGSSLWDSLVGKCSIYPDEKRAPKKSASAELYNLLNHLNNIRNINNKDWRISKEQKIQLLSLCFVPNYGKNNSLRFESLKISKIAKKLEIEEETLSGFVFKGKDKKLVLETCFTTLKEFIKIFVSNGREISFIIHEKINFQLIEEIDSLVDIFFSEQSIEKRKNKLLSKCNNEKIVDDLIMSEKIRSMTNTHSLSYKALRKSIPALLDEPLNSQNLFLKFKNDENTTLIEKKYINKNCFENEVISPVVKRSFIQTIAILNKIQKLYSKKYDLNEIVIELPRDKSSNEKKKFLSELNKTNEKNNEHLLDIVSLHLKNEKINSKTLKKLKLAKQQDWKDIYDGEQLNIEQIIKNPNYCEIDHIIPETYSFSSKESNLVVTKKEINLAKGEKTPFQFLTKEQFEKMISFARVRFLLDSNNKQPNKFENLNYQKDPQNDLQDFIARNIVDTGYVSRLVLNKLQDHYINSNVKIKVITGSITNNVRKYIFSIPDEKLKKMSWSEIKDYKIKDRTNFKHHAIDACIIALFGSSRSITNKFTNAVVEKEIFANQETGEIFKKNNYSFGEFKNSLKIDSFKEKIKNVDDSNKIKFSRKIVTKNNIQLHNETLYSFKRKDNENVLKIKKINLFSLESKVASKYFEKEKEKVLCYLHDLPLFKYLLEIYKEYKKEKFPFLSYYESLNRDSIVQKNDKVYDKKILTINLPKRIVKIQALRVIVENKSKKLVLFKNYGDYVSNKCGFDNFNWISVDVYKNKKSKIVQIPLNVQTGKFKNLQFKFDEKKLKDIKEVNNINPNSLPFFSYSRGTILIEKKSQEIFYIVGSYKNQIEIKPISCIVKSNSTDNLKKRNIKSAEKIVKEYFTCELDVLGNIYNKRSIL